MSVWSRRTRRRRAPESAVRGATTAVIVAAGALLALATFASGCASTGGARLDMPPTTIVGDPSGRRSDVYDAYDLFDRADRAFVAADWPTAIRNYQKLIKEYPDAEVAPLARYNLGLAFESGEQWTQALATYDGFPMPSPAGVQTEEVRMRRGVCLQHLKRYREAAAEYRKILQQLLVSPLLFNEARLRLGVVSYYDGDPFEAEHDLLPALAENERNAARGVRYARGAYGEGSFVMGEIRFRRFEALELSGQGEALAAALQEKAAAFVAAREFYTNAVRSYEPSWVTAALFRLGLGYELFYRAVLAAPEPAELSEVDRPAYRSALRERMRPALDKALTLYRRNLEVAADLRVNNEWIEMTRARYDGIGRISQKEATK